MPWRSGGAALMRQPSTTTSCVADMKATRKALAIGPGDRMGRIAEGEARKAERHAELREEHPGKTATEKLRKRRNVERVDDRRPKEFEGVGEGDIAQEADLGSRDADLAQPCRLRRKDEEERQARAEAERQHERETPIGEDIGKKRKAFCRQGSCTTLSRIRREAEHGAKSSSWESRETRAGLQEPKASSKEIGSCR